MQVATTNKISELQTIISRMPLEVFCASALPELGVRWREVSRAVRNARLTMQPASVARVLCRHVARALTAEEIHDIVARLRLKMVATQPRTWHVFRLSDKSRDEPVTTTVRMLPQHLVDALSNSKRGTRPEVQSVLMGDLVYLSVQVSSDSRDGAVLYIATPPGHPVLLASSANMSVLRAAMQGLGYKKIENANLYGRDITSLLRINDRSCNANTDVLPEIPVYAPIPTVTSTGIDYTNKQYDENYINTILGPNPPIITDLNIKTTRYFFDPSKLNKNITLTVNVKCQNVAETLKYWVTKGALAPTSDLFQIFHKFKSNRINYEREDSD